MTRADVLQVSNGIEVEGNANRRFAAYASRQVKPLSPNLGSSHGGAPDREELFEVAHPGCRSYSITCLRFAFLVPPTR